MPEHNSRVGVRGLRRIAKDFDRLVERRVLEERKDKDTLREVERLEREIADVARRSALVRKLRQGTGR